MKIKFCFDWLKKSQPLAKGFKHAPAAAMFKEYLDRISHFAEVETGPRPELKEKIWICHTSPKAKLLSSEELSKKLQTLQDSGCRHLNILIGGPDGFTEEEIKIMNPDLLWSFGPMTLPHELAAVVASEQIYRAWTILRHMPYHTGH